MRISDWSSDVCSSDLPREADLFEHRQRSEAARLCLRIKEGIDRRERPRQMIDDGDSEQLFAVAKTPVAHIQPRAFEEGVERSEEHTSELQSLMRISYAVFCLKKKTNTQHKREV